MRKLLTFLIALGAIVFAVVSPASAKGVLFLAQSPSYRGLGDVSVNGTTNAFSIYVSCNRVYEASLASASTNLCDLVDSAAPTVVICTLRGTQSGYVDQSAYCTGGVTPAVKCAAATGGVCNISKMYNQVSPGTLDCVQTTAASQPILSFGPSTFLVINNPISGSRDCQTTATFTLTNPYSMVASYIRTSGTAAGGVVGNSSSQMIGAGSSANVAAISAGILVNLSATATDNSWHGISGTITGTGNCAATVDGNAQQTSVACYNTTWTGFPFRTLRGAADQLIGSMEEGGIIPSTASGTDQANLYSNMKNYGMPGTLP